VKCVKKGIDNQVVILSHVNLLLPACLISILSPKTKVVLIAHGIEVWPRFSGFKKVMLRRCDRILTVSHYTAEVLKSVNGIPAHKLQVLNNCLDPFLQPPLCEEKQEQLLKKYRLGKEDKILMTLTRLAARERYKG